VLAGERMKMVTTEVATAIMSKTVDPEERRFGFTMPALIALITQAWFRERRLSGREVSDVLARLMVRAHALGASNPMAAFFGRPEPLDAYFDAARNLPVATPLMRKDCSPICDGAAALILTSKPQAVRIAGLGSATETSSILEREALTSLGATRHAAQLAYWRAGIARPRELEGLAVEVHDAFNSLLPIGLADLGLVDPDAAVEALVGDPQAAASRRAATRWEARVCSRSARTTSSSPTASRIGRPRCRTRASASPTRSVVRATTTTSPSSSAPIGRADATGSRRRDTTSSRADVARSGRPRTGSTVRAPRSWPRRPST
jgi:hypothetical protein